MNYVITEDIMGLPPVAVSNTVQGTQPGMIVHAVDSDGQYGGAEMIYLPGCAGTVPGSIVSYDPVNQTTALGAAPASGAAVAVAMSANLLGSWGWYMTYGAAVVRKDGTALTAGGPVGLGTANGTVGTVVATRQLLGATALNAAGAGAQVATVEFNRAVVAQS